MDPHLIAVDPRRPSRESLAAAVEALRRGGVVAVPTETVYGLAVDPFLPGAVGRLNRLKGKPENAPALLLLADESQLRLVARDLDRRFYELAARFWPGPLTLVVRAAEQLPAEVSGGRGTVAVRIPGLALPRMLAEALGRPITGVSANPHGALPARTAAEVLQAFAECGELHLVLDGGISPGSRPSTLLDLTEEVPRLLREGAVSSEALRSLLPELAEGGRGGAAQV